MKLTQIKAESKSRICDYCKFAEIRLAANVLQSILSVLGKTNPFDERSTIDNPRRLQIEKLKQDRELHDLCDRNLCERLLYLKAKDKKLPILKS